MLPKNSKSNSLWFEPSEDICKKTEETGVSFRDFKKQSKEKVFFLRRKQ